MSVSQRRAYRNLRLLLCICHPAVAAQQQKRIPSARCSGQRKPRANVDLHLKTICGRLCSSAAVAATAGYRQFARAYRGFHLHGIAISNFQILPRLRKLSTRKCMRRALRADEVLAAYMRLRHAMRHTRLHENGHVELHVRVMRRLCEARDNFPETNSSSMNARIVRTAEPILRSGVASMENNMRY